MQDFTELEQHLHQTYKEYAKSSILDVDEELSNYQYDRGRRFIISETAFKIIACDFLKQKIIPEVEAVRFSTIYNIQGINRNCGMDDAYIELKRKGVNELDIACFIANKTKYQPVLHTFVIPRGRMKTEVELLDGFNNDGGYKSNNKCICMIMLDKHAVNTYIKFKVEKIDDNMFSLQCLYDIKVNENLKGRIYVL